MAKVNDGIVTDDTNRKMSKAGGNRRSDLKDIVARGISGPEIIDNVVPGWLLEDECIPTRAFMTSFAIVEVRRTRSNSF